jgi:PBSX family phage terminase large subunit
MDWTDIKLNNKYRNFILASLHSTYNVAEGAWRSGKTVSLLISHIMYLDDLPEEGLHIIAAESISTAKTILLNNPSGLSYTSFFAERAEKGLYEGKDALTIRNSKGKKQVLIFSGASKSNSYVGIRGLTAMSVLLTEANLAHPSFIEEVIGRTISTPEEYRRLFFDLNPEAEEHWFYKRFLNVWQEEDGVLLNYEHFTFSDNPGLTSEDKERIYSEYDPESTLFRAFILGERITNADNIFSMRKENKLENPPTPTEYVIAVDPGVSASSTVFITLGVADKKFYIYNYYEHKNGRGIEGEDMKSYPDYAAELAEYVIDEENRYGKRASLVYLDQDVAFFRVAVNTFRTYGLPSSLLKYAIKDRIEDRIRIMSSLLYQGKLVVDESLQPVISAIENAVYDSDEIDKNGKLVRLDKPTPDKDIKNFCDFLDPIDYCLS